MTYLFLPGRNVATLNAALVPHFTGLQQEALVKMADVLGGAVRADVQIDIDNLYDFRNDILALGGVVHIAGTESITGLKRFDTPTGYTEFRRDPTPLNYAGTRAGFVLQHRDTTNLGVNGLAPGAVMQFTTIANGVVNAAAESSQSVWLGLQVSQSKSGDGSAHCVTAIGELGAVGPSGYSEVGLVQGTGTNIGSTLGTLSGVEMLLQDSPNAGVTSFSSVLNPFTSRIAKFHTTTRKSHSFYASSEGAQPPTSVLGCNPLGLHQWQRGFDFRGATFTTGQFGLAPNNNFLAWERAGGAIASILGVNNTDGVYLIAAAAGNKVIIGTSTFASGIEVDDDPTDRAILFMGGQPRRVRVGIPGSGGLGSRMLIVDN